jgi:hypothetical protein
MKMVITASTDGQHLGKEFDSDDNPIELAADVLHDVERVMELPDGARFISSNYIIDARKA